MAFNPQRYNSASPNSLLHKDRNGCCEPLETVSSRNTYAGRLIKRNVDDSAPGDGAQTPVFKPEGVYTHPAGGAVATWTTRTAVQINAENPGMDVGDAFDFYVNNDSGQTVT